MLAHLRRRHVAGVDRREAGGQHHDEGGLRLLHAEADLVIVRGCHLLEVAVPGFAWVDAKLLHRHAGQEIPGAFDVSRGERLAVMPFDTLAELQGQLGAVLVPRPFGRQVRHDRVEAVLPDLRVEGDQVVEHPQHRALGEDRLFLVDRHAGRAVDRVDLQDTARFLRGGGWRDTDTKQGHAGCHEAEHALGHVRLLPQAAGLCRPPLLLVRRVAGYPVSPH